MTVSVSLFDSLLWRSASVISSERISKVLHDASACDLLWPFWELSKVSTRVKELSRVKS